MYDIPWLMVVIGWTIMFVSYSITKLKTHRCGGGIYTMEIPLAHKQKWPLRALTLLYLILAGLFCLNFDFAELTFFYKEFSDFFILHGVIIFIIAIALYVDARVTISSNCSWTGKFTSDRCRLIQRGPYKRVRHPQPLAYFLAFLATSFLTHDARVFLFALCLMPMWYVKSMIDEQYLNFIFPEYEEYIKKTGRFLLK